MKELVNKINTTINDQCRPAVTQPTTTSMTEMTTRNEGFFFNIQQANSKLVKGSSLLKTLYLKTIQFTKHYF